MWSLVELQYAFVSFGMCGLGYLSTMLLTILSVCLYCIECGGKQWVW